MVVGLGSSFFLPEHLNPNIDERNDTQTLKNSKQNEKKEKEKKSPKYFLHIPEDLILLSYRLTNTH